MILNWSAKYPETPLSMLSRIGSLNNNNNNSNSSNNSNNNPSNNLSNNSSNNPNIDSLDEGSESLINEGNGDVVFKRGTSFRRSQSQSRSSKLNNPNNPIYIITLI